MRRARAGARRGAQRERREVKGRGPSLTNKSPKEPFYTSGASVSQADGMEETSRDERASCCQAKRTHVLGERGDSESLHQRAAAGAEALHKEPHSLDRRHEGQRPN